jgi:hypothetical protein
VSTYLERPADKELRMLIRDQGVTITITGPRDTGKTSMLLRASEAATDVGKRVAHLDFRLFDREDLFDADRFYRQFCTRISVAASLEDRVDDFWSIPLGFNQKISRYFSRYILKELSSPLALTMDELELLRDTSFQSDFFGMLRSWHNNRSVSSEWRRLDLLLVTSIQPSIFITNLNQSPFNVGKIIFVTDFTFREQEEINYAFGSPLSLTELEQLAELLDGHVHLTQHALSLIADGRISAGRVFETANDDEGPFGDYLRAQLFRLRDEPDLIFSFQSVIAGDIKLDDWTAERLQGEGLIRWDGAAARPRCRLYENYFRGRLYG